MECRATVVDCGRFGPLAQASEAYYRGSASCTSLGATLLHLVACLRYNSCDMPGNADLMDLFTYRAVGASACSRVLHSRVGRAGQLQPTGRGPSTCKAVDGFLPQAGIHFLHVKRLPRVLRYLPIIFPLLARDTTNLLCLLYAAIGI